MKTIDISGMGGGYENVCQQMLKNGLDWIEANPEKAKELNGAYKAYKGIYGVCTAETAIAKEFDQALMKGIDDATGAMHQAVVGHSLYIAAHGKDAWLAEVEKSNPGRTYEWDGTSQSCPGMDL
jgi:hypothetical protein